MSNPTLPPLPLQRPYYTVAESQATDIRGTTYAAIIANPNGKQRAFVFRLRADGKGWDEIAGDWQQAEKPNTISLSVTRADLIVSLSVRGEKSNDYPNIKYVAAGACAWFSEPAAAFYDGGQYKSRDEFEQSYSESGRLVDGWIGRINRVLNVVSQVRRFLRFVGVLT